MKKSNKVKAFILDYLKNKVAGFQAKGKMFTCPRCKDEKMSANIFPQNSHAVHCFSPTCGKIGDIYDVCRELEFDGNADVENEEIEKYLIDMFDIKTGSHINKLFEKYAQLGWDLVPVSVDKGKDSSYGKSADMESGWTKKSHKDIREWQEWNDAGLNMGVKGGVLSDTIIVDLDLVPSKLKKKIYSGKASKEEIEEAKQIKADLLKTIKDSSTFDFSTIQQDTFGGIHLFYKNDEEIKKCAFDYEGIHIDIQSDGGQAVVEPSIVGGQTRTISGSELKKMPAELKKFILSKRGKEKEVIVAESEIITCAESELSFEKLNGNRSNTFTNLGGLLRKRYPINDVGYILKLFNKLIDKEIPNREFRAMLQQINKYNKLDENVLYKNVHEFLIKHEEANTRDLKECLGVEMKDLKEVLAQLIKDNKVFKHRSMYKAVNKVEWKTKFIEESKLLDYEIPYFGKFATFRRGDMICIGSGTGVGKSYISLNIIRKLVEAGAKAKGGIRYLSSEPGNRFAKIAMEMGLKEGDFYFFNHYEPEKIELEDEAVTIIDWLLPEDFAQTANLYRSFARQLDRHGGNCFIFSQLNDKGNFYADQMVKFFASFAVKYFYTEKNGVKDNQNTYFKTDKIRESKTNQQYITIPTFFNNNKLELK